MNKHIVKYIGNGIWKDRKHKTWKSGTTEIFKNDHTKDEFLNSRRDIKFMVDHGSMEITTIIEDKDDTDKIKKDTKNGPKPTVKVK